MYQETEDVCVLFYGLAGGFASPMARFRVHPHHQGLSLALEDKTSQLAQAHKLVVEWVYLYTPKGVLQSGTILQAVTWHHLNKLQVRLHPLSPQVSTNPVIMISSHNESSRMLHAVHRLDVVQGGDAEQVGELLLLVAATVVAHPRVAHCVLVEPIKSTCCTLVGRKTCQYNALNNPTGQNILG